jgi:hypothetical protein
VGTAPSPGAGLLEEARRLRRVGEPVGVPEEGGARKRRSDMGKPPLWSPDLLLIWHSSGDRGTVSRPAFCRGWRVNCHAQGAVWPRPGANTLRNCYVGGPSRLPARRFSPVRDLALAGRSCPTDVVSGRSGGSAGGTRPHRIVEIGRALRSPPRCGSPHTIPMARMECDLPLLHEAEEDAARSVRGQATAKRATTGARAEDVDRYRRHKGGI